MAALAGLVPPNEFWRWKDTWSNSMRSAVFSAALVEYLTNGKLITIEQVAETLGSELTLVTQAFLRIGTLFSKRRLERSPCASC